MSCTNFNSNTSPAVSFTVGNLPPNFCHETWQQTLVAFFAAVSATLPGTFSTFIVSSTEPAAGDRDKLWLKVDASDCQPIGFFLYYNGEWAIVGENFFYAVGTGTANAVVATTSISVNYRKLGNIFAVKLASTNTGAATMAVNGLTADDIFKLGTTPLTGNEMIGGSIALILDMVTYYELLNPATEQSSLENGFWNGSFEVDVDGDGIPDHWTRTLLTGAVDANNQIVTGAGNSIHGSNGFKTTVPNTAGNGGASLTTNDFREVDGGTNYLLSFWMKASSATMHNRVEVAWYDEAKALLSTVTVFNNLTTNPTSWQRMPVFIVSPATAGFAKVILTGGVAGAATVNCNTLWDDFRLERHAFRHKVELDVAGNHTWISPVSGPIKVTCVGAGGGATFGGGPAFGNGGGGGGGTAVSALYATVGEKFPIVVGAGAANANGGDTSFDGGVVIGEGGDAASVSTGGAGGGTASVGDFTEFGGDGESATTSTGGAGGSSAFGCGGVGGIEGVTNNGSNGVSRGGGAGGGSRVSSTNNRSGAAGYVIIEW